MTRGDSVTQVSLWPPPWLPMLHQGIMQVTQHWDREVATSHPVPHPEIFSLRKHLQMSVPPISQGIPDSSGGAVLLPVSPPCLCQEAARPAGGESVRRPSAAGTVASGQTPPQGETVLLMFRTLRTQIRLTFLSLSRMHGRSYATQCCLKYRGQSLWGQQGPLLDPPPLEDRLAGRLGGAQLYRPMREPRARSGQTTVWAAGCHLGS